MLFSSKNMILTCLLYTSFSSTCEMLADDRIVERKPVECLILKKITVGLFRKTSIPAQLEEVYTIWNGHE